ncbi:MAG: FecR family protein [Treponema sp.]|jgi:hypothetical protein|nr:FecR family protein [Treponema sp.]
MRIKVLVIVMVLAAAALWAQSPRAVIKSVQGTVEIKKPGATWVPAAAGQALEEATLVSTGFKSSALLEIGNSTLVVRPLTRLSLREIRSAAESERVEIQLSAGRIRADVKPPTGGRNTDFTVRSPTATASVRGTVFEFDTVNLSVDEGTVSFFGADNTVVYVMAGQTSAPDPVSGKTAAPVEIAEAQASPLPVGVDTVETAPELIVPPLVPVGVGLGWN